MRSIVAVPNDGLLFSTLQSFIVSLVKRTFLSLLSEYSSTNDARKTSHNIRDVTIPIRYWGIGIGIVTSLHNIPVDEIFKAII